MFSRILILLLSVAVFANLAGAATISGELRKWHRVTLLFDGPNTDEENSTNPFTDYRLIVTFTKGAKTYEVHGHYAADGNAAATGATSGNKWRVYFSPDEEGDWTYTASFRTGSMINISDVANAGSAVSFDGETGSFSIGATNKTGNDLRAKGRLNYVGEHYLRFAETGEYFIKGGTDSPENLLAYWEFDQTEDMSPVLGATGYQQHPDGLWPPIRNNSGLHRYTPHVGDWHTGDPTWHGNKGKGIIGAMNYLASRGANSVYFITYNLNGGDGRDTWMWTSYTERERFDVSKLDQWEIVFKHMDSLGIQMNVLTQETENDGNLGGNGNLNNIRKLYYKELISRYAHHLAIVWNMGEENTNTDAQRASFAQYFHEKDPYDSPVTVHTWNNGGLNFYQQILDNPAYIQHFEMTSLQGDAVNFNAWCRDIREYSASKGRKWVICGDELDAAIKKDMSNLDYHRGESLWGGMLGGGGGMEWYFGYAGDFGDLQSEDFAVVEPIWDQTKIALDFFHTYLPFHEMEPGNNLASATNGWNNPKTYCFQKPGEIYAIYVDDGINNVTVSLNIAGTEQYSVQWFNPRTGGALQNGSVTNVTATNGVISLGQNPNNDNEDWVILVKKIGAATTPEINIRQGANNIPSGGSYSFANTNVGASTDISFTVQNTGTAALTLNIPVTVSGDYSLFTQPSATVNPAGTTTFTVRFTPTASGTRTGVLVVNNNDSDESGYIINFSGVGVAAPEINIKQGATNIASGGTYTFANTNVGVHTDAVFTIENTGSAALNITTPLSAGGDYTVFSQPAASVAASGATTFTVRFTPSASGTRSGALVVSNNDSDEGGYMINFSGVGVATTPEINIKQGATNIASGGAYTFANTNVGVHTDAVFTIENTGNATLNLTTPVSASGDYSVISQPGASVAATSSATFTVRFTPSAGGLRTGQITLSSNDADEASYVVNFSGEGIVPPPTSTTWTGNLNDDWFNNLNWTDGAPTATLDVVIPNVAPKPAPVIAGPVGTIAEGKNLTVNTGAQVTISNLNNIELIVHGNLTNNGQVLGTGRLTFNGPSHSVTTPTSFSGILQVKAGSTLNTNGNLTLEDGASLLHGAGTPGGSGTVNGAIKYKRTGNAGAQVYTYWASPVAAASASVLGGSRFYYDSDNATDGTVSGLRAGWVSASGSMAPGLGYISQGTQQIQFNGVANEGDYNVAVKKNAATTVGWNLLGNPYPSGLDAAAFIAANSGVIYGSLYFWDDDATGGSGWSAAQDYAVWNGAGSVAGPNSGTLFNGHIAAGQGFFVEKIADGTANVQFANNMRSDKNNAFFRMAPVERIKMSVVGPTGLYNETLVAFMQDATDGADNLYDARKLKGNDNIALYTKIQDEIYAIQALAQLTTDKVITMGIDAGIAGDYTLNLKSLEHLDETVTVILEDTYTGHFQSLRMNPVYTFNAAVGNHADRFRLHFNAPLQLGSADATCAGADGLISIRQDGAKQWNYVLKNQNGIMVNRSGGFNGVHEFNELPAGIYELTLIDADGYNVERTIEIKGKTQVSADFSPNAYSVYEQESIAFQNSSNGAIRYIWDFGDGNNSEEEHPVHVYAQTGMYEVTLVAQNAECFEVRSQTVEVMKLNDVTGVQDQQEGSGVKVFTSGTSIFVQIDANEADAAVYDILGKKLVAASLAKGMNRIELRHFAGSYCLLQLNVEGAVSSRKLVLNSDIR